MKFPHTPLFHCFLHDKSSPNIPAYEHINVKHQRDGPSDVPRDVTSRQFFKHTILGQHTGASRHKYCIGRRGGRPVGVWTVT